jgi:hypothetical protein
MTDIPPLKYRDRQRRPDPLSDPPIRDASAWWTAARIVFSMAIVAAVALGTFLVIRHLTR